MDVIAPGFNGFIKAFASLMFKGNLTDTLRANDESTGNNTTCKLSLAHIGPDETTLIYGCVERRVVCQQEHQPWF